MDTDSPEQPDIEATPATEADRGDSLDALYLAPLPRSVPLSVRLGTLLGTPLGCFSWFFIGFGMIFVWTFTLSADFASPLFLLGKKTVEGTVVNITDTGFGTDEDNDSPVMAYKYSYTTPSGSRYEGAAYSDSIELRRGEEVEVEYASSLPSISRIRGMARTPVSMFGGLFVLIFPTVGLVLLVREMRYAAKALRLLRIGKLAYGIPKAKEATNEATNDQRVYEFAFEFEADDLRTYRVKARASRTQPLEDDVREPLLYDPANPACAVMLDTLPGPPVIDSSGNFGPPARAWLGIVLLSIVPVLTIVGHGLYICYRFFR